MFINRIKKGDKLYCVTRRDIPPGYQAVQGAHAYMQFAMEHPRLTRKWYEKSQYMCFLSVEDEHELMSLVGQAKELGIPVVAFQEPDVDYAVTAICIAPGKKTKRLCANLSLALSEFS